MDGLLLIWCSARTDPDTFDFIYRSEYEMFAERIETFFQSSLLLKHARNPRQATIRITGHLNVTRVLPLPSSKDIRLDIPIHITPDECAPSRIPKSYSPVSPSTQLPKHTLNVITNTYLAP
jgi:hypothetical protein